MRVRLLRNLGKDLSLPTVKEGEVHDMPDDTAKMLIGAGLAEIVDESATALVAEPEPIMERLLPNVIKKQRPAKQ